MKYKIIYIASLVLFGILVSFALVRPAATSDQYSEVSKENMIKTEDGFLVSFEIMNREGAETRYTIEVNMDNRIYSKEVSVLDGGLYTYLYHIYPERLTEGKVNVSIYKMGQSTPFENIEYYVK